MAILKKGKITKEINKGVDEVCELAGNVKKKYDSMSPATKKKIGAGIIGAAVVTAGIIGAKKMMKKKRK